jgi:hypothetical protein
MSLDFNSKISGAETLGFSFDGKLIDDKKVTSQTEIKLDRLRKIVLDLEGMAGIKNDGNSQFLTKFDLITPFEQASTVNFENPNVSAPLILLLKSKLICKVCLSTNL